MMCPRESIVASKMADTLIHLIEDLIDRYLRSEPISAVDFGSIRDTITSFVACDTIREYLQEKKNFQDIQNTKRYCSPNDMLMEIQIRVANSGLGPPKGAMIQVTANAAKILRAVDALVQRKLNGEVICDEERLEMQAKIKEFRQEHAFIDSALEMVRLYVTRLGYHVKLSPATIMSDVVAEYT